MVQNTRDVEIVTEIAPAVVGSATSLDLIDG
jgi:hypothetical protein